MSKNIILVIEILLILYCTKLTYTNNVVSVGQLDSVMSELNSVPLSVRTRNRTQIKKVFLNDSIGIRCQEFNEMALHMLCCVESRGIRVTSLRNFTTNA